MDSALENDKNYYPQVFLKVQTHWKKKVIKHITDDLEIYSDDSDDSNEG